MPSVAVRVQHHPQRATTLGPLLAAVPDAVVVPDPDPRGFPSPWRTYRACLELPVERTHLAVLQDDATVCRNFRAALDLVVAARPANPIVLFVGGAPRESVARMERACRDGEPFAILPADRWVPAVAVVWPVELIRPILDFVDRQRWPAQFRADDEILGRATRALGMDVLATVPSLVEHRDVVPSVVGRRRAMAGLNRDRVAWCFADDVGTDPLTVAWTGAATTQV